MDKYVVYINENGEISDTPPLQAQPEACDFRVEYCATAIVPDGFTFQFDNFKNHAFAVDTSGLSCLLETVEIEGTASSPCGGTLTCPVLVDAVRIVGCVRFHLNEGGLLLKQPGFQLGNNTLCFDTTVCVNQVIAYICPQETCVENCFRNVSFLTLRPVVITDPCGRQIVTVSGNTGFVFTGCS